VGVEEIVLRLARFGEEMGAYGIGFIVGVLDVFIFISAFRRRLERQLRFGGIPTEELGLGSLPATPLAVDNTSIVTYNARLSLSRTLCIASAIYLSMRSCHNVCRYA